MTADTNRSTSNGCAAESAGRETALHALRARYRESRDIFSPRELAHLHFLRWLVQTGRLRL